MNVSGGPLLLLAVDVVRKEAFLSHTTTAFFRTVGAGDVHLPSTCLNTSLASHVSGGCALRPVRMVSRGFARRRCVVTYLLKSRYDRFSRYLDQLAVDKFQHSIGLREKGFL
ncbi:hypothetical protein T4A_11673 [Trichinella pseudospiralis]|uniref:Uncharacterized protein n=1 Tax=Trichinella pseudospiralis TaxID=6337 RepID=A0A0V1DUT7_TRIPS|nr:hypothetical protein T4A_11673 [Trichinella pseudospiralis]